MPQPGDRITDRIRLLRELGSGGMGSVWVANHAALQTQVVVKFMHAEVALDIENRRRFSREAAAGANVKSPHVAQVLDHGVTADGVPFIVMELLEGRDLWAYTRKYGTLTLGEVELVVAQTCKALGRAHERGIVHRDVKPQNIFLTSVGRGEVFVKVLDFGIAKSSDLQNRLDGATKSGATLGTPYYMSPEQFVGAKDVDLRTDLWALGVVAFECLIGRRAFDGQTVGGLAVSICSGPIPVPSALDPTLPNAFDDWFAKACARDLSRRFASAAEMADALQVLVAGRPLSARFAHAGQESPAFDAPASASVSASADSPAFAATASPSNGPRAAPPTAPVRELDGRAGLAATTRAPMTQDAGPASTRRTAFAAPLATVSVVIAVAALAFVAGERRRAPDAASGATLAPTSPSVSISASASPARAVPVPDSIVGTASSASPLRVTAPVAGGTPRPLSSFEPAARPNPTGASVKSLGRAAPTASAVTPRSKDRDAIE